MKMSPFQLAELTLIRSQNFNFFNGQHIWDSLMAHRDLWKAVKTYDHDVDVQLRELAAGRHHFDTLYILPKKGHEEELEALAKTWHADEINWIHSKGIDTQVLRVWWD